MRRNIKRLRKGQDAYLTVYLALVMTVLLSLCLTLIEGVRRNAGAVEAKCITDIGLNSIMAEYHRELFHQYNLFAMDSSYGTVMTGADNTKHHLRVYLERNMSLEDIFLSDFWYRDFLSLSLSHLNITKVSVLTDENGGVFRRRAVEAVKDDMHLSLLEELKEWMSVVESEGFESRNVDEEKAEIDRQIQEYNGMQVQDANGEWITLEVQNPTIALEEKRRQGILKLVTQEEGALSVKKINQEELIAKRMQQNFVNKGNMSRKIGQGAEPDIVGDLAEDFLFREYLLRYMGHYNAEKSNGALDYQMEYLLVGADSDIENLRSVANRLLLFREAANAAYLLSDETKCAEAELAAQLLAVLMQVPEAADLLKATILFGWSFAESIYDVKTILSGGRIPLVKTSDTWHYGLEGALQGAETEGGEKGEGLAYEDYLRIFMMLTGNDILTARAMNMVEADIRTTRGNAAFRLDGCFDGIEAELLIKSGYGYTYEIVRQKWY